MEIHGNMEGNWGKDNGNVANGEGDGENIGENVSGLLRSHLFFDCSWLVWAGILQVSTEYIHATCIVLPLAFFWLAHPCSSLG